MSVCECVALPVNKYTIQFISLDPCQEFLCVSNWPPVHILLLRVHIVSAGYIFCCSILAVAIATKAVNKNREVALALQGINHVDRTSLIRSSFLTPHFCHFVKLVIHTYAVAGNNKAARADAFLYDIKKLLFHSFTLPFAFSLELGQ